MNSEPQGKLFYSIRCAHSKQLVEWMKKMGIAKNFEYSNVDSLRPNQIPPSITRVPTMLLRSGQQIIIGKESIQSRLEELYNYSANKQLERVFSDKQPGGRPSGPSKKPGNSDIMEQNAFEWSPYEDYSNPTSNVPGLVFDNWDMYSIPIQSGDDSRATKSVNLDAYMKEREEQLRR